MPHAATGIDQDLIRLNSFELPLGARAVAYRDEWDTALEQAVVRVRWVLDAPQGDSWPLSDLDELCSRAGAAVGDHWYFVYCEFYTKAEFAEIGSADGWIVLDGATR